MKYAVISDIHGNLPGLEAVMSDALAQGAEKFLFLGDYITNYTWVNEVVDLLRGLDNAVFVSGNHEYVYYRNIFEAKEPLWRLDNDYDSFKLVYWAYRELSAENRDFLLSLPKTATVDGIHMEHAPRAIFREPWIAANHSHSYWKMMLEKNLTHDAFLAYVREALPAQPGAREDILALPAGVYLFGHNHLQYHFEYEGRYFINPGSCGEPLDLNTDAAYVILEFADGRLEFIERRVHYDVGRVREKLAASGQYAYSPEWWNFILLEGNLTGRDYTADFFNHSREVAREMGIEASSDNNELYKTTFASWELRR